METTMQKSASHAKYTITTSNEAFGDTIEIEAQDSFGGRVTINIYWDDEFGRWDGPGPYTLVRHEANG